MTVSIAEQPLNPPSSNHTHYSPENLILLAKYRPQLWREIMIDRAIATIVCTPEEISHACQEFYGQAQIPEGTEQQVFLDRYHINPIDLKDLATRQLRIEKFKCLNWEHKLESYFLKRKGQLDRVIYFLLRVEDSSIAQELFFRLQAGEQSFAELAQEFSQGPEAYTGGLIGPVELGSLHPMLRQQLVTCQPHQLLPPTRFGDWITIVRLERLLPCQLDETMRQRLLNELFETWLQEQMKAQQESAN